ncbi:hypothetical protein SERRSCBI_22355 [Serratia sp. SCBI]|nr:hypothetical protein SERRSCBI_22355 [Serratia sp. SCBI]
MGHPLFVAALVHPQIATILFQRLPQPQYVAVAENRENARNEFGFHPVGQQILVIEKSDERLRHG